MHQWTKFHSPEYNAGSIYVGIASDYIGMKSIHEKIFDMNNWEKIGTKIVVDGKSYVVNCNMKNGMSFDDMLLIMYNQKQIDAYEIGKANSQEILDVLCYASEYFKQKHKQKQKKK